MKKVQPWSIATTRDLVLKLYGDGQLDLVQPSLESIPERQRYARYHYREVQTWLDKLLMTHLNDSCLASVALGCKAGSADDYQEFMLKVGANFTACIQSLHSIADILAYAIHYSLDLDRSLPKPLQPSQISAPMITELLKTSTELAGIHELLYKFHTGGSFAHLSALVNVGKHRSIVRPSIFENYTKLPPSRHTLIAPALTYKGAGFPEVSISEFLKPEYRRCDDLILNIGNALNAVLQNRVATST